MKVWTPAEIRQLGVAPRAKRARFPKSGQVVPVAAEPWIAECAGGVMLMHDVTGIGFLSTAVLAQLVQRGEPVPLGPLVEPLP